MWGWQEPKIARWTPKGVRSCGDEEGGGEMKEGRGLGAPEEMRVFCA